MDPLNEISSEAHRLAIQARRAFLEGHPETCKETLSQLSDYLSDESASEIYDKFESKESSDGS